MIMYNKWIFILWTLTAVSCGKSKDFSKIRKGEQASDILRRYGAPASRRKMPNAEWWVYNDPDKHVLVINSDTIANVLTQAQAMQIMRETLQIADSLHLK
jgi:hypothetical protein